MRFSFSPDWILALSLQKHLVENVLVIGLAGIREWHENIAECQSLAPRWLVLMPLVGLVLEKVHG